MATATAVPRRYRFRHPLVCHAIYESASEGWRLAAHQRFFVVISDVDVDHVDGFVERGTAVVQVVDHRVPASLFAGEYHVDHAPFRAETALVAFFLEG